GNDYERSKLLAEQMVRGDDALQSVTVYRPAIIIGDSRTGYTSTFHGFYVPLQAANNLMRNLLPGEVIDVTQLFTLFGLTGREQKNFVPVDWISAAMVHILARPEH